MKKDTLLGVFKSKGRLNKEANSKYRSPFQRDRDRIIHSASFRRLKHKTQVFVNTEGDHFRTRITHSIEVAQIARSIAKYLKLNEDLAETLSLAHDLNKYFKFAGLNLTLETLEGLLKHNGPVDDLSMINKLIGSKVFKNKINFNTYPSLEAQISAISDDIAYNNHDIQDGIKANLFKLEELVELEFFKDIYQKYKNKINKKNYKIAIYQIIRDSIDIMIRDLLSNTEKNIKKFKIKSLKDVSKSNQLIVSFSGKIENSEQEIRSFLRHRMYDNKSVN